MRTKNISCPLGNPGTFLLNPGDPMYYTERLSYTIEKNLYQLSENDFQFRQSEDGDFSALQDYYQAYFAEFSTWLHQSVISSSAGDPMLPAPTFPDLPILAGLPGAIFHLVLELIVNIIVRKIEQWLDAGTEASEVGQVLRDIFLREVPGSPGEEFSLIELIGNFPLQILIDLKSGLQDISFDGVDTP